MNERPVNLPPETTSFRKRNYKEFVKPEKKSRKKRIIYEAKKERKR